MNKLTIVAACLMFALGAAAGRWTVGTASAMDQTQVQPFEMMKSAYALPIELYEAI